jgi:hypothetical protein
MVRRDGPVTVPGLASCLFSVLTRRTPTAAADSDRDLSRLPAAGGPLREGSRPTRLGPAPIAVNKVGRQLRLDPGPVRDARARRWAAGAPAASGARPGRAARYPPAPAAAALTNLSHGP